jgi:two-component system, chemotaxis family, protein-glutamate methylesterase/glutaminase
MPRIRVLVVDDAVVIRRLVSDVLGSEPDIEVVGVAANGRLALAKIPQVNPDCITLDVEMPEMDGLETLKELRKTWPKLPVIMFSTLTVKGATRTFDALALGATDYVTKPANIGSVTEAVDRLRNELVPKIRAHTGRKPPASAVPCTAPPPRKQIVSRHPAAKQDRALRPVEAICIATSTGGPAALSTVIPSIPASVGVPILIVQHMPPLFTALLSERLNQISELQVNEGSAGQLVEPGHIYVAPGGRHMEVRRNNAGVLIELTDAPPENSCRPAADVLFRSAAAVYGPAIVAAVLTGMGQDGLRGAESIAEAGGEIIAQDEASSVVWGMPGAVVHAGLAQQVLPVSEVAVALIRAVERRRLLSKARN